MMFHSDTRALIDLWTGLSRAQGARGGLPERAALRPDDLGSRLTRVFLAERLGDDAAIRLAGDALEAFHASPLTGARLLTLWRTESRALITSAMRQTVRAARPIVVAATAARGALEVAMVPFRGDGGGRELILGLYAPPGALPRDDVSHRLTAQAVVAVGEPARPRLSLAALDGRRIA